MLLGKVAWFSGLGNLEGKLSKIGILAPLLANYLVLGKLHNSSTAFSYLNMKLIIVPIVLGTMTSLCKLKNSFKKCLINN